MVSVTSPAPLVELTAEDPCGLILANEIDIILAQERARLNPRFPAEFDNKVANVDPLNFYVSCLSMMRKKFADNTIYFDPTHQVFKHKIHLEIARLQQEDKWPSSIPTLAEQIENRP